jgi:hypothetical protein
MTKKTIIEYLKEKFKSKPATREEIDQLKLEVEKAIAIRDIRIAKAQTPSKFAKLLDTLTTLSNTPEQNRRNRRKTPKI